MPCSCCKLSNLISYSLILHISTCSFFSSLNCYFSNSSFLSLSSWSSSLHLCWVISMFVICYVFLSFCLLQPSASHYIAYLELLVFPSFLFPFCRIVIRSSSVLILDWTLPCLTFHLILKSLLLSSPFFHLDLMLSIVFSLKYYYYSARLDLKAVKSRLADIDVVIQTN